MVSTCQRRRELRKSGGVDWGGLTAELPRRGEEEGLGDKTEEDSLLKAHPNSAQIQIQNFFYCGVLCVNMPVSITKELMVAMESYFNVS